MDISNSVRTKELFWVFVFIYISLALFIPEIVFFQKGFLGHDYYVSVFPYYVYFYQNIKKLNFPVFVDELQAGFPLIAEGQAGIFYPLNIIFALIFPLLISYQVLVIVHFILGGLFSYVYIRNKGVPGYFGLFFALVFMFGSTFSGIRYNTVVQRVWIWFPLVLYFIDKFINSSKKRYLFFMSVIICFQIFAGHLQIAFYCLGFYILYFLFNVIYVKKNTLKKIFYFIIFLCLGLVLSWVQWYPSLKMVKFSVRNIKSLEFCLWGASNPLCIFTPIFNGWDFFAGGSLYIGTVLFVFIFLFFKKYKEMPYNIRVCFLLFVLSFVLSLGKFGLILPLLIKLFKLYGLRKPQGFLFFSNFFLSTCLIYSMSRFFRDANLNDVIRIKKVLRILLIVLILLLLTMNVIASIFKTQILEWGREYVKKYVYKKEWHIYSLDTYYKKLENMFISFKNTISISNFRNSIPLIILFLIYFVFSLKRFNLIRSSLGIILIAELYIFSFWGTGLKGNLLSWRDVIKKPPSYVNYIQKKEGLFRIYNFFDALDKHKAQRKFFLIENRNVMFGIPSVGIYSPLVSKNYYFLLRDLGCVDATLGIKPTSKEILKQNLGLLGMLNVKYVISSVNLQDIKGLNFVFKDREEEIEVYSVDDNYFAPRFFFASKIIYEADKNKILKLLKRKDYSYKKFVILQNKLDIPVKFSSKKQWIKIIACQPAKVRLEVYTPKSAFLVFSQTFFPGWRAFIDRRRVKIYPVNLILQGVKIPSGRHTVEFFYSPYYIFS